MSLLSPYESAPYSYDVFSGGVENIASGTASITLYVPKFIPSIPTTAVNGYEMNVLSIGELSVNFDVQNEGGDITDFKFNVPSFNITARDPVKLVNQNVLDTVTTLTEALGQVPNGFVSVLVLTFNSTNTYFYVKKTDFSLDVETRQVKIDGVHPLAMNAVPFGQGVFESYQDGTEPTTYTFAGYYGQDAGYTIGGNPLLEYPEGWVFFNGTDTLITQQNEITPIFGGTTQLVAPKTWDFIAYALRYYTEDIINSTVTIDSLVFDSSVRSVDFGGDVGVRNCVAIMAGDLFSLKYTADENTGGVVSITENTLDNQSLYVGSDGWWIRALPSFDSFRSDVNDNRRRMTNAMLKDSFLKLARMDAAYFGSILGETFYVSRAKKTVSHRVDIDENDLLSLSVKQENIDPSTLTFRYPVVRAPAGEGTGFLTTTTVMHDDQIINSQGASSISINFEPATFRSFYESTTLAEVGQNMGITRIALVNDGDQTCDYLLPPIYWNSSQSLYKTTSLVGVNSIESQYYQQYSQDISNAYKNALKAGTGITITGEILGIDQLKAYQYIRLSSVHPYINGKDFRISSISYNLEEDKISFEAYEF